MPDQRRGYYQLADRPPEAPGPDAGLAAIAAEFHATAAAGAAVSGAADDIDYDGGGGGAWRRPPPSACWPLRVSPQQATAATNYDPVDWGPPTGRAWRIDMVVITLSGASQVSFYKEAIQPVNLRFQTTTSGVWEPRMLMMVPGERLIATFTGGGAIVAIEGEQIDIDWLAAYML